MLIKSFTFCAFRERPGAFSLNRHSLAFITGLCQETMRGSTRYDRVITDNLPGRVDSPRCGLTCPREVYACELRAIDQKSVQCSVRVDVRSHDLARSIDVVCLRQCRASHRNVKTREMSL